MASPVLICLMMIFSSVHSYPDKNHSSKYEKLFGWIFSASDSESISESHSRFLMDYFEKEPFYVSRTYDRSYYADLFPGKQWPNDVSDALSASGTALDVRVEGKIVSPSRRIQKTISNQEIDVESVPPKHSIIIRYEQFKEAGVEIDSLRTLFKNQTGLNVSLHAYISGSGGSQALKPHTDPYGVIVLQITGRKTWTICTPSKLTYGNITTAERARLYAVEHANGQSCVSYLKGDLSGLSCNQYTMDVGDALYMPKDVIHFAETNSNGSMHLTIGLDDRKQQCEKDDWDSAFLEDVVQAQVSRRRRDCTSYDDGYDCDTSCDSSCDSSCDWGYSSCDSSCDVCDDSCDEGCDGSASTGWIIGVVVSVIFCCICVGAPLAFFFCCGAAAARNNPPPQPYPDGGYGYPQATTVTSFGQPQMVPAPNAVDGVPPQYQPPQNYPYPQAGPPPNYPGPK